MPLRSTGREVSPGPSGRVNQTGDEREETEGVELAAGGSSVPLLVHPRQAGSESEGRQQREQMRAASLRSLLQRNGDRWLLDGVASFLMMGET